MEKPIDYLDQEDIDILRQRIYNLKEGDNSQDDEINELQPSEIAGALIGWEIGSDSWLDTFIDICARARGMDNKEMKELIFPGE